MMSSKNENEFKKVKSKEYQKQYYEKNKKKIINKMKDKYKEDKEKYRQRNLANYYRKKAKNDIHKPITITVYYDRNIMI